MTEQHISRNAMGQLCWLDKARGHLKTVGDRYIWKRVSALSSEWNCSVEELPAEAVLRCRADAMLDTVDPEYAEDMAYRLSEGVRLAVNHVVGEL